MSQRHSGYTKIDRGLYETPPWVTKAGIPHLPARNEPLVIWEPCAASGKMARELEAVYGAENVFRSDILGNGEAFQHDFLSTLFPCPVPTANAIITNPPYDFAQECVERALELMKPVDGLVAMLLSAKFDFAGDDSRRQTLFRDCRAFAKKLTLTKRIVWFDPEPGKSGSPSENHAWYFWDWMNDESPTMAWWP